MPSQEKLLDIIGLLYDAALKPDAWQPFLAALTTLVRADSAYLRLNGLRPSEAAFLASVGYDEQFMRAYSEHFFKLDYYAPALEKLPTGVVSHTGAVISHRDQLKTEYYNDYERPQDKHYAMGGHVGRCDSGRIFPLGVQRGRRSKPFDAADMALLETLMPHVARAMQIRRHLCMTEQDKKATEAALHRLPLAIILVDATARPVFVNARAETFVGRMSALRIVDGRLATCVASDTASLRRLIAGAVQTGLGKGTQAGGCLKLTNVSGASFQVLVAPLPTERAAFDLGISHACAALFLSSDAARPRIPQALLMQMYPLTRAEARLASALIRGDTLDDLAERWGISKHTARAQLKAVFQKTDTRRQSELTAALLSSPLIACYDRADAVDAEPLPRPSTDKLKSR